MKWRAHTHIYNMNIYMNIYIYECAQRNHLIALYGAGSAFGVQAGTLARNHMRPCIQLQALWFFIVLATTNNRREQGYDRRVRLEGGGELFCIAPV